MFILLLIRLLITAHCVTCFISHHELYRLQLHYSPPYGWMNDPNGLVYDPKLGIYHFSYQYNPKNNTPNPTAVYWGHSVSRDLIHWKDKPIVLYPTREGSAFSGTVVIDKEDVTRLKSNDNDPFIAFFTRDIRSLDNEFVNETQHIWYSDDRGKSYKRFKDNPVLVENPKFKDFRDPKIIRFNGHFITVIAAGDQIRFYKSGNLINWKFLSSFGTNPLQGSHGERGEVGIWECPDLIPFKVEGKSLWVLVVSINPGGPITGSATQYFVGNFDGVKFTNINPPEKILWLDYSPDNYAGITYEKTPKPYPVFIAWANNWAYGTNIPTSPWRGQATIPRSLHLEKVETYYGPDYRLRTFPIEDLNKLRYGEIFDLNMLRGYGMDPGSANAYIGVDQWHAEIEVDFDRILNIILSNEKDEMVKITLYDNGKIIIDRSQSGDPVSEDFRKIITGYRVLTKDRVRIDIIHDAGLSEIFWDKGFTSFTVQSFPTKMFNSLSIVAYKGKIIKTKIFNFKSIWN